MPAGPSPAITSVVPVPAHIPMGGSRCCELPWTPGSSQGLECPCASTPRSAAVPARIPHRIPAVLGWEGLLPQGYSGSTRLGGRGPAPPARSVLFPAVAVGSGCEGADAAAPAAKALPSACEGLPGWGGHRSPRATPPRPRGTAAGQDAVPPKTVSSGLWGGAWGGVRDPAGRKEVGEAWLLACLPPSVRSWGHCPPSGPSGRSVRSPPQALYPRAWDSVCVGPTGTRGWGGAGQRVAGLPCRARQRGHLGTIQHL